MMAAVDAVADHFVTITKHRLVVTGAEEPTLVGARKLTVGGDVLIAA